MKSQINIKIFGRKRSNEESYKQISHIRIEDYNAMQDSEIEQKIS